MYNSRQREAGRLPENEKSEELEMMKRLFAILLAVAMVLCAMSALAENADADPVLVTVNGEEIRESTEMVKTWKGYLLSQVGSDADEATMQMVNQYALEYTIQYTAAKLGLEKAGLGITQEELDAEKAAMAAEAKAQWDEAVDGIAEEQFGITAASTDEEKAAGRADAINFILTNYGITEEDFTTITDGDVMLNTIYSKAYSNATQGIAVTDEEVEAHFNELVEEDRQLLISTASQMNGDDAELSDEELNKAMAAIYEMYAQYYGYGFMYQPEGYKGITHILLPVEEELLNTWKDLQAKLEEQADEQEATEGTEATDGTEAAPEATAEPVTQEMVDAAKQAILDSVKEKVDEINAKLASGTSFEDLILEYGTDPGMQDEKTRAEGYPVHAGSLVYDQNFTNGAAALQNVGDVSDPVVSQFGVHILHYLRDLPSGAVEFTDEVKQGIYEELLGNKQSEAFNAQMAQWKADAVIEWTEAGESWKIQEEAATEAAGGE